MRIALPPPLRRGLEELALSRLIWAHAEPALAALDLRRGRRSQSSNPKTSRVLPAPQRFDRRRAVTGDQIDTVVDELLHPPRSGRRYLRSVPLDGWGRAFWVRCPGRYDPDGADVVSAGPSGTLLADDNLQ